MANLVITSDSNRIYVAFNDYTSEAGMPNGDWDKSAISIAMNLSNTDIFFSAINEQQWRFSFNSQLIVDSVDGVAPVSNADLFTKLSDALIIPSGGSAVWGGVTGTLADQTDLQTALNGKATSLGADDNYVTDSEKVKLTNLSGTNTGDQDLSGKSNVGHTHSISDITGLQTAIDGKQATLVSATNIKTVNGSSILGSGDLVVSSGYHFVGSLSGDQATGANVTPVTLTGLVFSYIANSKYRIWAMGNVAPTASTTGCGFQFDLSSAVTSIGVQFFHQLANTGTLSGGHSIADDASVGVSSGMPGASTYPVTLNGILITGANAGTAQLRFRSETTAVTTCKSGFTMVIEKIA